MENSAESKKVNDDKKSVNSRKTKNTLQFDEFKNSGKKRIKFESEGIPEEEYEDPKKTSFISNKLTKISDKYYKSYMFKVIMLGNIAVGKTCLLSFFTDNIFKTEYNCTIGCDFKTKAISPYEGCKVDLQIWDTCGEEKFRSITKGYYRDSAGIVLVFDVTNEKSFNDIVSWIDEIKLNSRPTCKIVLVANKCDLKSERVVTEMAVKRFAEKNDLTFFESSAKTGNKVSEIFRVLSVKMIDLFEEELKKDPTGNNIKDPSKIKFGSQTAYQEAELPELPRTSKKKNCC